MSVSKISELAVVAIDFGTTFSGYAYSFKSAPSKVYTNEWSDGNSMSTTKTPSVLLLNPNKSFNSFGYEAEAEYAELANKDEHFGFRYFKRFKMLLASEGRRRIKENMEMKDEQGNGMKAVDVFSAAIKYLKDHALDRLSKGVGGDIQARDIRWVLTVPAIWDNDAKQFMHLAANKAGIAAEKLVLAYEPEAAAVFCKDIEMMTRETDQASAGVQTFGNGSEFIVFDLGGGTIDITALKVKSNGNLESLSAPSGGPWGGIVVDKHFQEFLKDVLGAHVLKKWVDDDKAAKLDLDRAFEHKKRTVERGQVKRDGTKATLTFTPGSTLFMTFRDVNGMTFQDHIKATDFKNVIEARRDRLFLKTEECEKMFDESESMFMRHVRMLMGRKELRRVKIVVMVGGFSESPIMQNAVKAEFPSPKYKVIVPPEAGTAVVQGAVIYGHNTDSISSRKMPYSYGISTSRPFNDRVDPDSKRCIGPDGTVRCEDIFESMVRKDETVIPNKTSFKKCFNATPSRSSTVEIYRSTQADPRFVTDAGCCKEAELEISIDPRYTVDGEKVLIEVEMLFGDTEITVKAGEVNGKKKPWVTTLKFMR